MALLRVHNGNCWKMQLEEERVQNKRKVEGKVIGDTLWAEASVAMVKGARTRILWIPPSQAIDNFCSSEACDGSVFGGSRRRP